MADNPFLQYWYFHVPNYVLAVLAYTLLGRFLLGFFVPPDSANYIWRFFRRLTDPVVAGVGFITPGFISPFFLPLVGMFWLTLLRFFLLGLALAATAPGGAAP